MAQEWMKLIWCFISGAISTTIADEQHLWMAQELVNKICHTLHDANLQPALTINAPQKVEAATQAKELLKAILVFTHNPLDFY